MQGINGDDPLSAELTCQVALHAQRADVGLRNLTKLASNLHVTPRLYSTAVTA